MDYMKLDIQLFAYYDGDVTIRVKADTKEFEQGLDKMQDTSKKAGSTIKNIVAGLGITKLISKGMQVISSSVDDAVKRVDTLNNFPKVMKSLGISAEDSSKAINKMSDKLAGLPTTLDQGASAVQRFTSYNGDVKKSTDIFLAVNNAILAGGASAEAQASALEQLTQAYTKGKPEANDWKILMQAMPAQLKQVANTMGYTSTAIGGDFYEALQKGEISMDDFMDTMIKLNKEGGKGFDSFSKQAKVGTEGIATSMKVAKTQVVKGVADIITGLDKGLKKSGTSISKIFADLGKGAKQALDKVATALSKINFAKLINTIKTLIPVLGSLTAGFVAYNAVLKAIEIKSAITNFASLTKQFITMIPAMTGANASMVALNTTISISPIGLLIAGVAGLATGLVLLGQHTDEYIKKANEQTKANREVMKSQEDANKEMQKTIDNGGSETQYYKNLQAELKTIVDENGKIKEGYEDRAKVITGILKDALGVEVDIVDGVIKNYKEYNNQIDKTIVKKKAQIVLNAQEEQYTEAIKNQLKYQKQVAEANKEIEKWQRKINEAKQKQSTLDPLANKAEFEALTNDINQYQGYLSKKQEQYNTAKAITDEYTTDIAVYEQNLKNFQSGNYDAMIQDMNGYVAKLSESNQKKKEALDADIVTEETTLANLKALKKQTNSDIYNDQIAAHEQTLEQYKKERADLETKIVEDRNTWLVGTQQTLTELSGQKIKFEDLGNGFVQSYVNGQTAGQPVAYENLEEFGKNIQSKLSKNTDISSEEAKKLIKKYSTKLSDSDSKEKAKKSTKEIGKAQIEGIESQKGRFVNAGQNSAQGVVDGATSPASLKKLRNAGVKMGNAVEEGYKSATKTHSPSRLFIELAKYIPAGIAIGIDKNSDTAVDSVKSMVDEMYSEMERTVDLETAKVMTSVQTSGTYQVAMSGSPTFNLSDNSTDRIVLEADGRKLAEVVNTHNRNREVAKA